MKLFSKNRWQYFKTIMDLSIVMSVTNFKSKNRGSYLGVLWYILTPLILLCMFVFIKGSALKGTEIENLPLFIFIGLILLNFFRKVTDSCIVTIRKNRLFIKNINLPKEPFVISNIMETFYAHLFEVLLLVIFIILFNGNIIGLVFYILIITSFILTITGIGFILSVVGAYIKDFSNIWSTFMSLLLFGSGIFYIIEKGSSLYNINIFNPLFHYITITRDVILYGTMPSLIQIVGLIFFPVLFIFVGIYLFNKNKHKFAEII